MDCNSGNADDEGSVSSFPASFLNASRAHVSVDCDPLARVCDVVLVRLSGAEEVVSLVELIGHFLVAFE